MSIPLEKNNKYKKINKYEKSIVPSQFCYPCPTAQDAEFSPYRITYSYAPYKHRSCEEHNKVIKYSTTCTAALLSLVGNLIMEL